MSMYLNKLKRTLALLLSFVMLVSVFSVAPGTTSEAAAKKIVKRLAVSGKVTLNSGQSKTINAKVTATKKQKYGKNDLRVKVSVPKATKKVISVKLTNPKASKKKISSATSKLKITAKNVTAKKTVKFTVTAKSKNKKGKTVKKTVSVTVNPKVEQTPTPPTKIAVTGVTLDSASLNMTVNQKSTLNAIVTPANATDKSVTWTSSADTVASVDANGTVTAKAEGTAAITVKTNDGGHTAVCNVTVTDSSASVVDGLQMSVTNALEQYSDPAKSGYVLMTGSDATVRVRLMNNGSPVGNQKIKLTMTPQYGNAEDLYKIESSILTKIETTDADGYATFAVTRTDDYAEATATDQYYQSYSLAASSVTNSKITANATLSFGCIYLVSPFVLDEDIDGSMKATQIIPGENAQSSNDRGTASVASVGGAYTQEYVTSQQVTNPVTMVTYPVMHLPATAAEVKTGVYEDKSFAKKSGEYSVYNDEENETTTTVIDTIPAGLEYATISFDAMELSEYTKLVVTFYEMDGDVKTKNVVGEPIVRTTENIDQKALSIQVPVKADVDMYAVIALYSEGQVNDDKNKGYSVTGITGMWASSAATKPRVLAVDNTVEWSKDTKFERSTVQDSVIDLAQLKNYLPAKVEDDKGNMIDNPYCASGYTYSYNVPTFPHVGNAVITVKNAQGQVAAYYTYPIQNKKDNGTYKNTHDIASISNYRKAVQVSKDEYEKSVGELTPKGRYVTVASTATGYTPLTASISLKGIGVEVSNSEAYSFIQWSPQPEQAQEANVTDFYALAGQNVSITAQLYDTQGNKVSQSGKAMTFTTSNGAITDFTATQTFKTDVNGQCTFNVRTSSDYKYIENLKAAADGYKVKLIIGEQTVEQANIHWVAAGLYFKDQVDGTTTKTINNKTVTAQERAVGSNWLFGMRTYGETDDLTAKQGYEVSDISGITIGFSRSGVGEGTSEGCSNGEYKLYSESAGTTTVTGAIDKNSVTNSVKITVVDAVTGEVVGTYANVGTGETTASAQIALNVQWSENGTKVSIETPMGISVDQNVATTVYVKVTDTFGNKKKQQKVTYTVTELGQIAAVTEKTGMTDENGLLAIPLKAPLTTGDVHIGATSDGISAEEKTINYTSSNVTAGFGIEKAVLNKTNSTVTVTFNSAVKKDTLDKAAFILKKGNTTTYDIISATLSETDNRVVILTLKEGSVANITAADISLTIDTYEKDNMTYQIMDTTGRVITGTDTIVLTEAE